MPSAAGRLALVLLIAAAPVGAQSAAPTLSKSQRDTLQAVVAAVDAASAAADTTGVGWQNHVLRTSDGAHYVAFTLTLPPETAPGSRAALYVRLARRQDPRGIPLAQRSAVMEWLKGMRSDPLVAKKQRGIAFGEMPTFGPGGIAARGPGQQASDLSLLTFEQERAREKKEAAERERKAALEGAANNPARDAVFPFEDFAVDTQIAADIAGNGPTVLRRSLTAGPGEYDLFVAWTGTSAGNAKPPVHVVKRSLDLPPASSTGLSLSSVILADRMSVRETPYPPDAQSSHPYAIGAMDIVPAADQNFTNEERLTIIFQVLNARADALGKPDVAVSFQLVRLTAMGEQPAGSLSPQYYTAATLPADFDLTKGHPLFAAVAAPLKTLPRSNYRLRIGVTDKVGARSTSSDVLFRIVATPSTLLATAPMGAPLDRNTLVTPALLGEVAGRLRSERVSPAMSAALDAAREGRLIDLLREDAVEAHEHGARLTLRGVGLFALGDPRIAAVILRQAMQAGESAVSELYLGACRSLEGDDRDAVDLWQSALAAGVPVTTVGPLLVDAYLRLADSAHAAEAAARSVAGGVDRTSLAVRLAAIAVAEGREDDALPLLDRHLASHAEDLHAQYTLLHALLAGFVHGRGVGSTAVGRERFLALARAYIDAKGPRAAVVAEWLEMTAQ